MIRRVLAVALLAATVVHAQQGDVASGVLSRVGFFPLPGLNADVWVHRGFAYVGTWGASTRCPATGVRIVDVSRPEQPSMAGAVAQLPGSSQEDVVVAAIATASFAGDLLAVGVQSCELASETGRGVDLWDVSDPRRPEHLAFWSIGPTRSARGVHELHLFQRGDRAYVAAAVPYSEQFDGVGDFRLVDVTDPRHPVQVSAWGAIADGRIQPRNGDSNFAHSAIANARGDLVAVSYWDAGAILLDISDPSRPVYLGRTIYPAGTNGDTHRVAFAHDDTLVLVADEGWQPRNGAWGALRLWDINNRRNPQIVGGFATPNATRPPQDDGTYSIHNPVVQGNLAILSWYSDGVRALDITNPAQPREIGSFVPEGTADPFGAFPAGALVWGVALEGDLVFASDMNAGLYVLRLTR